MTTTQVTQQAPWNAYEARFWVQTVRRAEREGIHVMKSWGYVVRCRPVPPSRSQEIYAWAATKRAAVAAVAEYERAQRLGFWGCPCGSGKQAVE